MREKKRISMGVKELYSQTEAVESITAVLSRHSASSTIEFLEKEANITDGYYVRSRGDRLRICAIISRSGVTGRSPENLAAEWLIHNIAFKLNFRRASAVDVALDYEKDIRWQINLASKIMEKLSIY